MNTTKIPPRAWCRRLSTTLLGITLSGSLFAQATPPSAVDESTKGSDDIITLTPFQVDTTKDEGYFAQNTLAGSRMRTNVADLASSITVITAQQLEDTASVDINDVFRYEANTEGALTYTPSVQSLRNDGVVDVNAGYTHGGDGNSQTNAGANRVRGLGAPSSSQNYYPSISQVPFDAYNIQSIEISRGPNSMLFGMGSPAGIVNNTTAQAVLNRDSYSASLRVDDRGSFRASANFNHGIIEDKLAIYGAVLSDNKRFERKPSYDDTTRLYGAITFRPFQKTVLRASIEQYENDNRRPNTLTPRDGVTEWRTGGGWALDTNNLITGEWEVVHSYGWYNRSHNRFGTLWAERFKSVLVEPKSGVMRTMAAYIDLNAVRAGLVDDPKDYRFCGYGEAVAGNQRAQLGLNEVGAGEGWEKMHASYRQTLFGKGAQSAQSGQGANRLTSADFDRVIAEKGKLPLATVLRCRVRYFSDGAVLGSRAFVQSQLLVYRKLSGRRILTAPRDVPRVADWGDLTTLRGLRRQAFG